MFGLLILGANDFTRPKMAVCAKTTSILIVVQLRVLSSNVAASALRKF